MTQIRILRGIMSASLAVALVVACFVPEGPRSAATVAGAAGVAFVCNVALAVVEAWRDGRPRQLELPPTDRRNARRAP